MATALQSKTKSRFTDLSNEPISRLLSPIKGYQDKPLVSLSEAIIPVTKFFNEIEDNVFVALHNCQNPADDLTQDESAAIHLYTMQFDGGPSLYLVLNETLRAENREELKPWFSFLKLFLTGLYKLPSRYGIVWRGIRDVDLSDKYQTGTKFAWWGVSSCTTTVEVLETNQFLGKQGKRTLFSIECTNGKSADSHSYFKGAEKEIILMPGSYFEVIGKLNPAPELHIIQLREINAPITLIKPPFVKASVPPIPMAQQQTTSPTVPTQKKAQKIIPNLPVNARWEQQGVTVAGGHGKGRNKNQLNDPCGLFVDDDDDQTIFIADWGNHRNVQWKSGDTEGQVVAGGNGQGNRLDQLNELTDVLIDKETNSLIIADWKNRRIVRWSRRSGTTQGEILIDNIYCCGLAIDEQRNLYISDYKIHEVRRYEMDRVNKTGAVEAGGNGKGSGLNQLNGPRNLFVNGNQSLYVSDHYNHRVMKWDKGASQGVIVAGGQGSGNILTQLSYPYGIFVDTLGTLYVAEHGNDRITCWPQGFEKKGTVVVGGNGGGSGANQLAYPVGLSFDKHGNLYVVDGGNHRVQRFNLIK